MNYKNFRPLYRNYIQKLYASYCYVHWRGTPYPYAGFSKLKPSASGPYPTSLPVANSAVQFLSNSIYGKSPILRFNDVTLASSEMADFSQHAWQTSIAPYASSIRTKAGLFGSALILYKFNMGVPEITVLDPRYFWYEADPLDPTKISALILQYPVQRGGDYYWYAEVWTDEEHIIFTERPIDKFAYVDSTVPFLFSPAVQATLDSGLSEFNIETHEKNPYGTIPGVVIFNNLDPLNYVIGDLFYLLHTVRRIDLVYHLMDLSNQHEAMPTRVFIDAVDSMEVDPENRPGQELYLESSVAEDGSMLRPDVAILEAKGSIRSHMQTFARDYIMMFYENLGVVFPRADEITNKGNMTNAILTGMYAPTQATLNRLMVSYGTFGMSELMYKIRYSAKQLEIVKDRKDSSKSDFMYGHTWKYYNSSMKTDQEKLYAIEGIQRAVDKGYIPVNKGIELISDVLELNDVDTWIEPQTKEVERTRKIDLQGITNNVDKQSTLPRTEKTDNHG